MDTIQALIKHYIESNGYTVYSISQQSGINRTTLQKIFIRTEKNHKRNLRAASSVFCTFAN